MYMYIDILAYISHYYRMIYKLHISKIYICITYVYMQIYTTI